MVLIYVRHSNDEASSDESLTKKHDAHINKKGKKMVKKFIKKIIAKFGQPEVIYYSPFARGRETLEYMKPYLSKDTKLMPDPRLSRYFTSKEKKECSIFTSTAELNPPVYETRDEFHERVKKQYDSMKKAKHLKRGFAICITHAVVLKRIAARVKVDLPKHYSFLEWFALKS
jgi:broad specificity phosphatase PhoE